MAPVVCTGINTGSRKLLEEKRNLSRPEAESARTVQWAKLQVIPQMTKGGKVPDQPCDMGPEKGVRMGGSFLLMGLDLPHSQSIQ